MRAKFEYLAPTSLDEACALLHEHEGDAKLLAGGTALVMWLRMGLLSPGYVIDLENVPGLDGISYDPAGGLRIGAGVKHRDLELCPEVQEHYPLLRETFYKVAQPRIRLMATVGGNLSHGDPMTDPGASFMALDAEVTLHSSRGERTLSVEDFFVDYYETALEPDEILTSIHVPPPAGPVWSHIKFTPRSEEDFATVGVAVTMTGEGSRCDDVRIALNSVAPTIFRARAAEDMLRGRDITPARLEEAGAAAADAADPIEDVRGSSDYKRELAAVFVRRALEQAAAKLV
ncbi:MAG: xanthine dehydrogenase family protein subunit M [Deltaproteobacteria bacterium]|nr:xanthine dehydrogenase family protein subunit M [Deltaproteobacteria bacterium]